MSERKPQWWIEFWPELSWCLRAVWECVRGRQVRLAVQFYDDDTHACAAKPGGIATVTGAGPCNITPEECEETGD